MKSFAQSVVVLVLAAGVLQAQAPDGKALYTKNCKECHGVLGKPTKASLRKYDSIPDFSLAEVMAKRPEAEVLKAVREGKGRDMKGFKDKLSAEEITVVVKYMQTLVKGTVK